MPVNLARRLPCSKTSTARSVHHSESLWKNAKLPWEKQTSFLCRQLLYMLEDEICDGDQFLKCMFSIWRTKTKSVSPLQPWYFFKMHSNCDFWFMICDTTWKSDGNPDILMPAAAEKTAIHLWKLILPPWNTSPVAGKIVSTQLFGKLNALWDLSTHQI